MLLVGPHRVRVGQQVIVTDPKMEGYRGGVMVANWVVWNLEVVEQDTDVGRNKERAQLDIVE